MRQRRTMRRRAPVCPCSATRPRARDGEQGGAGACVRTAGRVGVGGHGGTHVRSGVDSTRCRGRTAELFPRDRRGERRARRGLDRQPARSAARRRHQDTRPSRGSVPPSSAIRAFPSVPTWASCKSSGQGISRCECSSAAWAKPWPAVRVLARRWRWAAGKACSRRTCASICRAEPRKFLGEAAVSTRG